MRTEILGPRAGAVGRQCWSSADHDVLECLGEAAVHLRSDEDGA